MTKSLMRILDKDWKITSILFLVTFLYYFIYFKNIFISPNSALLSIEGDSIKNYYVFLYHTVHDTSLFNFTGFNYPFGENVVYTDCQPLLTFIFKLLPFTHNYLVGLLHLLILFSYVITPYVYYKIFRLFNINALIAFLSSFAVVILSPQLMRLSGHFGLSYACFIPLLIYFLVKYSLNPKRQIYITVLVFNFLLFFIHPYMGMGLSLFTLLYLILFEFTMKINWRKLFSSCFIMGVLPIILFKLILLITDNHPERSPFPHGVEIYVSTLSSLFLSSFNSPFDNVMQYMFNYGNREWEGMAYIGFFSIVLIAAIAILLIVFFKRFRFNKIVLVLFVCGIIMLLFSMGLHTQLLKHLNIEILVLNQFRAAGRFAWFFYYILPVFLIVSLNNFLNIVVSKHQLKWMSLIAILFLAFNMYEGHYYLSRIISDKFKQNNIFISKGLKASEKRLVKKVNALNPQAIMPLPFYHIGSDVIGRAGLESCYISMLLSYHCKKPIVSAALARASIPESIEELSLLNRYYNHDKILSRFNDSCIAIVQTPSEKHIIDAYSLLKHAKFIHKFNNYNLFTFNKDDFNFNKNEIDSSFIQLKANTNKLDTLGIKYTQTDNKKPFIESVNEDYEILLRPEPNEYPAGKYILSFHYHFKKLHPKNIDCHFIVEKTDGKTSTWESMVSVGCGNIYTDKIVLEKEVYLDPNFKYTLMLHGGGNETYTISNFLFRPSGTQVIIKTSSNQTLINNYPYPYQY